MVGKIKQISTLGMTSTQTARSIVYHSLVEGAPVTNQHLQLLLYWVQIEAIKLHGMPVFADSVTATPDSVTYSRPFREFHNWKQRPILSICHDEVWKDHNRGVESRSNLALVTKAWAETLYAVQLAISVAFDGLSHLGYLELKAYTYTEPVLIRHRKARQQTIAVQSLIDYYRKDRHDGI